MLRPARWLIAMLALLLCSVGPALGAIRSGSTSDPVDVARGIDGYARPDITSLSVSYDPDAGTVAATFGFAQAVPRIQNGRYTSMKFYIELGSVSDGGTYCDAYSHEGDLQWTVYVYRNATSDSFSSSATLADLNGTVSPTTTVAFSADSTSLTITGTNTEFVRRNYTCLPYAYEQFPGLGGYDGVGSFYFSGFQPPPPPTDTTKPTVRWVHPSNNQIISGVWTESAPNTNKCLVAASDNVRVDHEEVYIDGVLNETQVRSPWSCEIDTRTLVDGPHTFRAVVYDAAGNSAAAEINVTVRNSPVPDTTKPSVRWTSPANNQTISGVWSENTPNTNKCLITATDNVKVNRVEVYVDGLLNETQLVYPWGCLIDTRTLADGPHVLRAVAYDAAGNSALAEIDVTVKNGATPPPFQPPVVTPIVVVQPVVPVTGQPVSVPPLKLRLSARTTAHKGDRVSFTVKSSRATGKPVALQQKIDGRFITIARRRATTTTVVFRLRLGTLGRQTFRVRSADAGVTAISAPIHVKVTR